MNDRPTRATVAGRAYLDLQNLARRTKRPTDELHQIYALEGFLARLVESPYTDRLILKGGVLLAAHREARLTTLGESLGDYATLAQRRWAIWLRKQHLTDQVPNEFSLILAAIGEFADPALLGEATGLTLDAANLVWVPTP